MEPYLPLELHTIVLAVLAVGARPVHDSMDHWMCIITDRNEYKFSPIHQKLKFEIRGPQKIGTTWQVSNNFSLKYHITLLYVM